MEYHSVRKRNKLMIHATTWTNLKMIALKEFRQKWVHTVWSHLYKVLENAIIALESRSVNACVCVWGGDPRVIVILFSVFLTSSFTLKNSCWVGFCVWMGRQVGVVVEGRKFGSFYWWSLMSSLPSQVSRPKELCYTFCSLLHVAYYISKWSCGILWLFIKQNFKHI